ncbi:coiled-coil domain-containing protein [Blastococcus atacamensis]|uniref:hypothetical protein n=1 Tax=Blastococcus atacamensis TaxID=2070508 RepID=UPI0012FFEA9A|nr:hypothetical protein [Blastococcus atacamensis]
MGVPLDSVPVRHGRWSGVLVAAALGLAALPGTASAAPSDPSVTAAEQAAQAASAQVGQLLAQQGAAQTAVDRANAEALRARAEFDAQQQAYVRADATAQAARGAAERAQVELSAAKDAVAAFARSSYMSGTTSPILAGLITSGSPAQALERAALLEAVGAGRTEVLAVVSVAREQAVATQSVVQIAVAEADRSRQTASAALASAEAVRTRAADQMAELRVQQEALLRHLVRGRLLYSSDAADEEEREYIS